MTILFVATVVKTHIMEFHIPYLKMFKEMGFRTAVAAKNDYENSGDCCIPYCDAYYNIEFDRSPFSLKNLKQCTRLKGIIENERCDIVYCHTPVGGAIGRLAGRMARNKPQIVYMAHGFHFYDGAGLKNQMFYPIEKLLSRFTDVLITINQEDFKRAKENFNAKRTLYINGIGFDYERFARCEVDRHAYRKALGIPEDAFVVISVGELIKRKNHETIIEALGRINKKDIYFLLVGRGELAEYLKEKALKRKINIVMTGYRGDVPELCKSADVFAFPSKHEGLAIAPLEAMAARMPVVASDVRGVREYCNDSTGGVVPFDDVDGFAEKICTFYGDRDMCKRIGDNNTNIAKEYDLAHSLRAVRNIFEKEVLPCIAK